MLSGELGRVSIPSHLDTHGQEASCWAGHNVVRTLGNKNIRCILCQKHKVVTKSGWESFTKFQCSKCNVPLCRGKRDCFYIYHNDLQVFGGVKQ